MSALGVGLRSALKQRGVHQAVASQSIRSFSFGWESVPEEDYVIYPRERVGMNYALNWSLAEDGVIPSQDAFYNLTERGLIMNAQGKLNSSKSLEAAPFSQDSNEAPSLFTCDENMHIDDFEATVDNVMDHLGAKDLFVFDGSLSSSNGVYTRFVCEDAVSGLFVKHMLNKRPTREVDAEQDVKVFVANQMAGAKAYAQYDKEGNRVALFVTGVNPGSQLLETIASTVAPVVASATDSVALTCDALLNPKDNSKVSLAFGLPGKHAAAALRSNLYAAHHVLLSNAGTSRLWAAAMLPSADVKKKLAKGDLVLPGGMSVLPFPANNMASFPSVVAFVEDGGATKDLTVAQACERAESQLVGGDMGAFKAMLEAHKPQLRSVGKKADPKDMF